VIVDSTGKTLSQNTRDPLVALSATQLDFQRGMEKELERRVEEILGRVVGDGHVVARVNADLDFSQVTETFRSYDADGSAVISEQNRIEKQAGARPGPYGAAGAQSNTPGTETQAQNSAITSQTDKENSIKNYRVPETLRKTRKPFGNIKKLSVAVVIDRKREKEKKEDGTIEDVTKAWSDEELAQFEQIVSGTLGFDKKRGDSIQIKNLEFKQEDLSEIQKQLETKELWRNVYKIVLLFAALTLILMFFFFVVRPFIKWVTENTIDSIDTFLPQTLEELEKLQKTANIAAMEEAVPIMPERVDPEKVEGEMMKEKIVSMVDGNPQKAALVLREWVRGEGTQAKAADTATT